MLTLQKEHQSVRREDDLDRVRNLERQIAQMDAEIDQRVYALSHSATLRGSYMGSPLMKSKSLKGSNLQLSLS